jgi:predicted esterase
MFKSILREFIKIGEKDYNMQFFFLEGEYKRDNGKQWFDQDLNLDQIGKLRYPEDISETIVHKCLSRLHQFIVDNSIDVLFGFSQGGNVINTYINHFIYHDYHIKYAVIFSGYNFIHDSLNIQHPPLLNVFSEADDIVKPMYRPTNYDHLEEMTHDKGHKMPTSKPMIREILKKIYDNAHYPAEPKPSIAIHK